jgi:HNH endonuclease
LCAPHYTRWRRTGDAGGVLVPRSRPLEVRFWEKVESGAIYAGAPCWCWKGYTNAEGYGRFRVNGRLEVAHRVAYELLVGSIPDGMQLDHLCRNRACVNPAHLEPVTPTENIHRSVAARLGRPANPTKAGQAWTERKRGDAAWRERRNARRRDLYAQRKRAA